MVRYSYLNNENKNKLEQLLTDICYKNFGVEYPYCRKLDKNFIDCTINELKEGNVYVANDDNDNLIGFCIISPPHCDKRVEEYAKKYECNNYMVALIIDKKYREKGYAKNLLSFVFDNIKGGIILITPKRNIPAISLYKKFGIGIVDEFEQIEQDYSTGEDFNLQRVVIAGK